MNPLSLCRMYRIIQRILYFLMFIAQSIYINIQFLIFHTGKLFILKKCHILFPLKIPVKRISLNIVMISCHQINPGIRDGGKQVIYFFQFP